MAEKAKNNNNLIIGICAAVAVVVVIIVAIVLGTRGGQGAVDDSYFVSDGTKYVYTVDTSDEEDEYTPQKAHTVYYYSGDKITGMKTYYEYTTADEAKVAYDALMATGETSEFKSVNLNGKYIVFESKEAEYENLNADEVKQTIELYETFKNMNFDSDDTESYGEDDYDYDYDYDEEDF